MARGQIGANAAALPSALSAVRDRSGIDQSNPALRRPQLTDV
jgi:hypothetical protein